MDEEDDPFSFITTDCHVTSSQQDLHRYAAFVRRHERFPTNSQPSNYNIPTESTGIRMLSLPEEEEFLTPEEDSLPAVSSGEPAAAVDLGKDSDRSTVVIEWGGKSLGRDPGEFMVVEREAVQVTKRVVKKPKIFEGLGVNEVVDLGADQMFDEMPMRNKYSKKGGDSGEFMVVEREAVVSTKRVVKKAKILEDLEASIGNEVVDLGADQVFDEMHTRNEYFRKGSKGNTSIRNVNLEMSLKENIRTQVVDLDEDETCRDSVMREKGDVSTEVVDLDGNKTCDEFLVRNRDVNIGIKVDEPCRDENRGLAENGILKIDKFKKSNEFQNGDNISQKSIGLAEARESPSSLDILAEIALGENYTSGRERNGGTAEKNRYENEKSKYAARKSKLRELPSSISGQTKNNQKMKNVLDVHELPSSVSGQKKNNQIKKNVLDARDLPSSVSEQMKNNQIKKNVLDARDLPSSVSGETENNQIMKNILDALGLVTGGQKEKVDDGSNEEVDFLETAMKKGVIFPRPRWWPSEGFKDD